MSLPSPLLGVTLDAIDRLDQAALKRQAEALVAQAVPAATPVQIQAVVQASLDHLPLPVAPVAAPKGPVDFGWKRPATVAEWSQKRQPGWWARQASRKWMKAAKWLVSFVVSSCGVIGSFGIGVLVFEALNCTIWGALGLLITTSLVGTGFLLASLWTAMTMEDYLSPARFQVAKKAWKTPIEHYLRYPETREFMRAVLSSAVPEFLVGDIQVLERRYLKASEGDRAAQAADEERAKQRALAQAQREQAECVERERQQEEREHQARLAEIAQALQLGNAPRPRHEG